MKLKKLEILGFKSFKDKTPIDLSRDINAIVGPNGCGKSNIVDAIRWVMGEQRVTMLRGKKMEDVIFNGSDDAPAVGMAEVSITLESNGHRVPEKYSGYREITVSRKIFREGESEYCINKVPCRLLDVKEFFMDAGVGARTYSIVEQDRIANLVEAKPEERRQFIEEAAGIMKYKTRRDSASRKMESTKQNIIRINDILREVRSQLNSTSRQAKKAERYRAFKKTIKEYQLALSLQTCSELALKIKEFERSRVPLDEKTLEAQTELKTLESVIENIRTRLIESEETIGSLQDEYYGIKNEINIREQKIEFANETISQLADKKKKDLAETESLREREKTTVEETALLKRQAAESDETITSIKDSIAGEQEAVDILKAVEMELSEDLEREKSRHIDAITENARLGNLLSSLTKSLEDLKRKAERECEEIDENNKKLNTLKDKLTAVKFDLSSDMERIELLKRKEKTTGENLAAARNNLKTIDTHITKIREETGVKTSRLTSLKDLQERHEWCDEGTRHILEAARERVLEGNIRGLVADYIEVPKEYEAAVEAALDDKLQYVIVENQEDGMQAIDYLKNHSSGRGSFVSLDNGKKALPSRSDCPEGIIRLCDLVHATDEEFGDVVHRLLEDILLVPDLDTATRLWQKNGFTGTYVTPGGEIIRPDGALTGGSKNGGGSSLGDRREIIELEEQIKELAHILEGKKEERDESNAIILRLEGEEAQLRSDIHGLELEINSRGKDIERLEGEIRWIEQHINVLAFNRENLESEKTLTVEKTAAVESEITSRKSEAEDGDRRILAIQEKWKRARTEVEESERSLTEKKILLISMEEKRKSGTETISRLEGTISEIDTRIESIAGDLDACDIKRAEAMEGIEGAKEALKTLYSRHMETEEELAEKREKHGRENIIRREKEQAIQKARKISDGLSKQLSELEMEIREAVIQAETLKEGVNEKLSVDLDTLLPEFQMMGKSDTEELRKKLETRKRRLEEFGEVNLLALSEHEELKERYNFLAAQIKDLNSSLDTLQKTITRINQISRKRFSETFEAVNHHFKNVFPRLFPGGRGILRLTDESDMLETGVDIDILIPGKNRQNLSLLSGGEKALAAVALIFSILMHRPAPFLILDEADAPLDDANISLFRELLKDISANSQIVFITHNKSTMEAADNLIGVTMEKNGISTTVSVSMN
ncbi:MAG: chromosome segregation protein SMC [Thermodesulfobacteriota bacterium]|nr:chromosome segregation protein SMC [Thermodesulfobacteriota bacterium]